MTVQDIELIIGIVTLFTIFLGGVKYIYAIKDKIEEAVFSQERKLDTLKTKTEALEEIIGYKLSNLECRMNKHSDHLKEVEKHLLHTSSFTLKRDDLGESQV